MTSIGLETCAPPTGQVATLKGNGRTIEYGILEDFIGLYLRLAYERAYADFREVLKEDALPPGYFTMLTLIRNNPGINQTEIGRAAGRDKSSVTKALRYMEDRGLIERTRLDGDRRTYISRVTFAGQQLHDRMLLAYERHLENLNRAIGPERRQDFLAALRAVADL